MIYQNNINTTGGVNTPLLQLQYNFLNKILAPGNFQYCASRIKPGERWRDNPVSDILTLVYENNLYSNQGFNTYFALSAFVQGWHHDILQNKKVFRSQTNAHSQRCLWLDIDVAPKSIYRDAADALLALAGFVRDVRLPDPTVVCSGKGLHVYWTLTSPIPTRHWQVMALMLKAMTIHRGFDVDHHRTVDSSSVLRLPGTVNYDKVDGVGRLVELRSWGNDTDPRVLAQLLTHYVQYFGLRLDQIAKAAPLKERGTFIMDVPQISDDQRAKLDTFRSTFQNTLKNPVPIVESCQQVREAGFAEYDTWRDMLGVMKHCYNGVQVADLISQTCPQKYPGYAEVERKFYELLNGGRGPTFCSTFDKHRPGVCPQCKSYRTKITTPVMLSCDAPIESGADESAEGRLPMDSPGWDGLSPHYSQQQYVSATDREAFTSPGITAYPTVSNSDVQQNGPFEYDSLTARLPDLQAGAGNPLDQMALVPFNTRIYKVVPGQGIIYKQRVSTENGEELDEEDTTAKAQTRNVILCASELYITCAHEDKDGAQTKRSYVVCKRTVGFPDDYINFDIDSSSSKQQFNKWIGNHALIPPNPKLEGRLYDYMRTALGALQNKVPVVTLKDHFGWTAIPRRDGVIDDAFILGDKIYNVDGVFPTNLSIRCRDLAKKEFQSLGSLETWKLIPKMYRTLEQWEAMFLICAGFAAPFMRYGNAEATNVILNLYAPHGGEGKTTLLRMVNSIWGNPKALMANLGDSPSSRYQVMGVRRNLPVCIDEITTASDEDLARILFTISSGRENRKSESGGKGLVKTGNWDTCTFFSSNKSLYDCMAQWSGQTQAPSMRAMDILCQFKSYSGTPIGNYIEKTIGLAGTNFGVAGPEFMRHIFRNPDLLQRFPSIASKWDSDNRRHSDERFWTYGIGNILAAGRIAYDAGLIDYDMDRLEEWGRWLLEHLRLRIKDNKAHGLSLFAEFMTENLGYTLVVKAAQRPADMKDPGTMSNNLLDRYILHWPNMGLSLRVESDTYTIYVKASHLKKWCASRRIALDTVLADCAAQGAYNGGKQYIRLGRGVTGLENTPILCYVFNGQRLQLPEEWRVDVTEEIKERLHEKAE